MFFSAKEAQGWVKCELLQTLDFGRNWTRVAPGQQFIPLGPAGTFDSHTLYTAWSGTQAPLINPEATNETMFYYAGGNGPHNGQRDDSIGLARATTHAYAGLKAGNSTSGSAQFITTQLRITADTTSVLVLASVDTVSGGVIKVGAAGRSLLLDLQPSSALSISPQWMALPGQVLAQLQEVTAKAGAASLVVNAHPPAALYAVRMEGQ
jgi:hypothetical protein